MLDIATAGNRLEQLGFQQQPTGRLEASIYSISSPDSSVIMMVVMHKRWARITINRDLKRKLADTQLKPLTPAAVTSAVRTVAVDFPGLLTGH